MIRGIDMFINWMILLAAIALLIVLASKASKVMSADEESGFLVAGRSLGPFAIKL